MLLDALRGLFPGTPNLTEPGGCVKTWVSKTTNPATTTPRQPAPR